MQFRTSSVTDFTNIWTWSILPPAFEGSIQDDCVSSANNFARRSLPGG